MYFKKKLAVVLSAATVLMSAIPVLGASGAAIINGGFTKGDLNGDKKVTIADVVILSQYLTKKATLTADQYVIADMNDDNTVNIFDMNLVKRTVLEIREIEIVEETTEVPPTEAPTTEIWYDVTTEVTTVVTDAPETDVTEVTTVVTDAPETDVTEVTTVVTDVPETDVTEVTTVVTDVPETDVTEVTTVVTEEVTTIETLPVTTEVTTVTTEPVTTEVTTTETEALKFPYVINIDPANTKAVEGVKFTVDADVTYNGAVQFFTEDGNFDVNFTVDDAVNGVITIDAPIAEIDDLSTITMVKICKYWQATGEDVKLIDAKVIIDGEEFDSYVEPVDPSKTANSDAAMMGQLGENSYWSVDDLADGSVIPTVDKNGTYTAKLVVDKATGSVDFLIIGLDGLKASDFADLVITVDSVVVDGADLATFDATKVVVNTGYAEGSFNGTRIYLTDSWITKVFAIPADTAIEESIEITFTVSGIND